MKKYIMPEIDITLMDEDLLAGVHSDEIDPNTQLAPKNDDPESWLDDEDRVYGGLKTRRFYDEF